jgi:hypothetical protein
MSELLATAIILLIGPATFNRGGKLPSSRTMACPDRKLRRDTQCESCEGSSEEVVLFTQDLAKLVHGGSARLPAKSKIGTSS